MRDEAFGLVFVLTLPLWLGMFLFPRHPFTTRLVTASWPFIALGALCFVLIVVALVDTGAAAFAFSLGSLAVLLASPWGTAAVAAQLVTLNAFAGTWIFRDTKYWGLNPVPYLAAALLSGPLGLALYLLARSRSKRRAPGRPLN